MGLKDIAKYVAQANKSKTPAEEMLFQIERAMTMDSSTDEYKGGVYRGSSIGGCLRNQYYQVENVPRDPKSEQASPSMVGILESGTDTHERIQNHIIGMKDKGFELQWVDVEDWLKRRPQRGTRIVKREGNEVRLANDILNLYSKCDGIVYFRGQYYVLEIKTEASFKHRGRTEPVGKHKTQAATYSLLTGIDKVLFMYINRDVHNRKTFIHEVTNEDRMKVVQEIETIESYRHLGKIPPMIEDTTVCNYCPFKRTCKKDGVTEPI